MCRIEFTNLFTFRQQTLLPIDLLRRIPIKTFMNNEFVDRTLFDSFDDIFAKIQ